MELDCYKVNRKHRDQAAKADCTQWIISEWEELRLFTVAQNNNWVCSKNCLWVIEVNGSGFTALGKTDKDLAYMAKYVTNHNHEWHGYPVTPSRNADRPPTVVLDSWRANNIISRAQQGKIVKGKF